MRLTWLVLLLLPIVTTARGQVPVPQISVMQRPVTRESATRAALTSGTRVALARVDSVEAVARLVSARALPNPTLAASYSKSPPPGHISLDLPVFDAFWTRGLRVAQATAALRSSRLLSLSERTAALVDIDTTYTEVLAARARYRLSFQTYLDADSLRKMSVSRQNAGDASELDVDLATVVAGQQRNVAADDSLAYMSAMLTLQTLMGLPADSVTIVPVDSLSLATVDTAALAPQPAHIPLPGILGAQAAVEAADAGILLQRRSVFSVPSLSIGVEFGDPDHTGLLPTIGIAVPLPLFNRNQGPIAEATAARDRARVQLIAAQLELQRRLAEGFRERDALRVKVIRDRDLAARADRVASRSLTAYREGAAGLPAVLEARRTAREVLSQYINDLSALLKVNTELRALTQPGSMQ